MPKITGFINLYIDNNPDIRSGIPIVKGTRLTVYDILSIYENNELNDYPYINNEMLVACLFYIGVLDAKE
jgi:uncharacterized protein (DUF433 family)